MQKEKILITGASGQLGTVLTETLRERLGYANIITTDITSPKQDDPYFEILDVLDRDTLKNLVEKHKITQIYHLVAILSAKGEKNPLRTWDINMNGLLNVLEVAREFKLNKIFFPSSIAIHGSKTPKDQTPQNSIFNPETVYGMSKLSGENWCQYYYDKFDVDVRSLRYPGIIGHQSLAGGGTTDYAVDIFHSAIKGEDFECFLKADSRLPMIYMDDAIDATIQLMDAPSENIKIRTSYNLAGMNFTPLEISNEIKKHIPDFNIGYKPDTRQAIADSWSNSIDDSAARKDWAWNPKFDLTSMTKDMLFHLGKFNFELG